MSSFFYRRLNFFNKAGAPLNFDYIGPTGPTPLDSKFQYIASVSVSFPGDINVANFDQEPATMILYYKDQNDYDITSWADEVSDYLQKGADVYLNGRVAGQQEFMGKIQSINQVGLTYQIQFFSGKSSGQRIISVDSQLYFYTTYDYRPGGYFKGNIYFEPVSSGLYENEQIFVVQEMYNTVTQSLTYGLPHTGVTGATAAKWRTRWYNDRYGETDISEIIFTYRIEDTLEGGEGKPLIVSYPNMVFNVDVSASDTYYGASGGYIQTSQVSSEALPINVALNSPDLFSNIYERKLIVEDISGGTGASPVKVIEIDFYGEITGEDERFDVMLQNLGRAFNQSDSIILRDHDPKEPLPDYLEINEKRKELLLAGDQIFPYVGSYKGLINAIKFFGYQDLRIKEYWLNLEYKKLQVQSPLQKNREFLDQLKAQGSSQGYTQAFQINDVLDNPNSGKYKMTQTYGPDKEGNYVLNVASEDTLLPSKTYKKTSLFGLYYDLNKMSGNDSDYGYPEVIDAFQFTQEEVLVKMFALKERLKRDYLPLNARIIDITGEGIYFDVYNTRAWTDKMERPVIDAGLYFEVISNPDFGFIEDLRNFSLRPLATSIQTPSDYFNDYRSLVTITGGTGSAIFFTLNGATGPNPTISITSGKTYEFSVGTTGYTFYVTSDPTLASVITPLGLENNGATSGGPALKWYVNPTQTSPLYYFASENPTMLNGAISVLPSTLSDLGNIVNPLDFQQNFSTSQNESLISAIGEFYYLKQQGEIKELGDEKYDPPAFINPSTGLPYKTPIGMPLILELILDRWSWDELNINWSAVNLPSFKTGDRVRVKTLAPSLAVDISSGSITQVYIDGSGLGYSATPSITLSGGGGGGAILTPVITGSRITSVIITSPGSGYTYSPIVSVSAPEGVFGTVVNTNYSVGTYDVLLDSGSSATFDSSELFAPSQEYGMLNWKNIDFSNMVDIEWAIDKIPTEKGSPYHFEFSGPVIDFYKLAHFVPYTGEYRVRCNIVDGFNVRSTVFNNHAIIVEPKVIEIDAWTRYREVEDYEWMNVYKGWDDYKSIWEFPAEGESLEELQRKIPDEILDFVTYGNKAEEGQDAYVKIKTTPIGATGAIVFTQTQYPITDITSYELISGGQYGFATITTSIPHGLQTGYEVTLFDTLPQLVGRWPVIVPSGSTMDFKIPIVLQSSWNGIINQTSPTRISVDTAPGGYTNQYFTGSGTITVSVGGREVGSAEAGDSLYKTANAIVSSVNSLRTYPDYFASCEDSTQDPVTVLITAPSNLGADQNGVPIAFSLTGSLTTVSASTVLGNGVSPEETYVFWSESSLDFPNANLKYWGTKKLNWDVFTDNTWEDGYGHGWYDFEYNNDWLGGYELHNIAPGDRIKLSTGNQSYPFPVGITVGPGNSPLTLQELADQLNSAEDRYITDFYYRPIPNEAGALEMDSPPINLTLNNFSVPNSAYPPAISVLGGSSILIPIIGLSGGNPNITTTTTTTTTLAPTTTTTTTTLAPTTTTTTTLAPTTTTTTTTTTTIAPGISQVRYYALGSVQNTLGNNIGDVQFVDSSSNLMTVSLMTDTGSGASGVNNPYTIYPTFGFPGIDYSLTVVNVNPNYIGTTDADIDIYYTNGSHVNIIPNNISYNPALSNGIITVDWHNVNTLGISYIIANLYLTTNATTTTTTTASSFQFILDNSAVSTGTIHNVTAATLSYSGITYDVGVNQTKTGVLNFGYNFVNDITVQIDAIGFNMRYTATLYHKLGAGAWTYNADANVDAGLPGYYNIVINPHSTFSLRSMKIVISEDIIP